MLSLSSHPALRRSCDYTGDINLSPLRFSAQRLGKKQMGQSLEKHLFNNCSCRYTIFLSLLLFCCFIFLCVCIELYSLCVQISLRLHILIVSLPLNLIWSNQLHPQLLLIQNHPFCFNRLHCICSHPAVCATIC